MAQQSTKYAVRVAPGGAACPACSRTLFVTAPALQPTHLLQGVGEIRAGIYGSQGHILELAVHPHHINLQQGCTPELAFGAAATDGWAPPAAVPSERTHKAHHDTQAACLRWIASQAHTVSNAYGQGRMQALSTVVRVCQNACVLCNPQLSSLLLPSLAQSPYTHASPSPRLKESAHSHLRQPEGPLPRHRRRRRCRRRCRHHRCHHCRQPAEAETLSVAHSTMS